jgi:Tol biopolymer transport system component
MSIDSAGREGRANSRHPSLSGSGRYCAFESYATLVGNDGNNALDVYVRDRDPDGNGIFDEGNGVTTRASVSSGGAEGDSASQRPALAAAGRWIAFESFADDLVANDTNATWDVFVRDLVAGTTVRASVDSAGGEGNQASGEAALSSDGQIVVFSSSASNLVAGDGNGASDVFVRDLVNHTTTRVDVDSAGIEADRGAYAPAVSADGTVVAFLSDSTNLVANDRNGRTDVFVHDRATGVTTCVSVDSAGNAGDGDARFAPALSADGQVVAFTSAADDLAPNDGNGALDVFVHARATGSTRAASFDCVGNPGDADSQYAALSADGEVVAFTSRADQLVDGDTNALADVFAHDRSLDVDASWQNYGAGFAGTHGIPSLTASADPVFGTTIAIDLGNSRGAATFGLLLGGLQRASIPTNAGGTILVDSRVRIVITIPAAGAALPWSIPRDEQLCGLLLDVQVLELDEGAAHDLSFTPGLELALGD